MDIGQTKITSAQYLPVIRFYKVTPSTMGNGTAYTIDTQFIFLHFQIKINNTETAISNYAPLKEKSNKAGAVTKFVERGGPMHQHKNFQ